MERTELIVYYHFIKRIDAAKTVDDYVQLYDDLNKYLKLLPPDLCDFVCKHLLKKIKGKWLNKIYRKLRTLCFLYKLN